MSYDYWKNLRVQWQNARKSVGLSKGAVSGVSLGDSIDAVEKAWKKGPVAVRAALAKLVAVSTKYKAGIAKNTKGRDWIVANIDAKIKDLDADCVKTITAIKRAGMLNNQSSATVIQALPKVDDFVALYQKAEKEKKDWYDLAKDKLPDYAKAAAFVVKLANEFTEIAKCLIVTVPGTKPEDELDGVAHDLKQGARHLIAASQVKTFAEFRQANRTHELPDETMFRGIGASVTSVAQSQGVA